MKLFIIIILCIGLFLLFGSFSIPVIAIIILSYIFIDFKKLLSPLKKYLK